MESGRLAKVLRANNCPNNSQGDGETRFACPLLACQVRLRSENIGANTATEGNRINLSEATPNMNPRNPVCSLSLLKTLDRNALLCKLRNIRSQKCFNDLVKQVSSGASIKTDDAH